MQVFSFARKNTLLMAAAAFVINACTSTAPLNQTVQFSLGKNASGDPCTASKNWTDPSYGESAIKFSDAYSINCRGSSSGALGRVRTFESASIRDAFSGALNCGVSTNVTLDGFSNAIARRCIDDGLGYNAVVTDVERGGQYYQFSTAPNAVDSGYKAVRILAGLDKPSADSSQTSPFSVSDIPSANNLVATPSDYRTAETIESILSRGTTLNFRGLYSEASQYLNTALNDLPADTPKTAVAELELEAALADSNIGFFGSANQKFDVAEKIVSELESSDQLRLRPKLRNYEGLHALNQRDFSKARQLLSSYVLDTGSSTASLAEPNTFVRLNSLNSDNRDVRSSISLPDESLLRDSFLYTQAAWALSVAEISLGNNYGANLALDKAQERFALLKNLLQASRIRQDGVYWMEAQLSRQRGRVEASSGNYTRGLELFDDAVNSLTRGSIAKSGTGSEPAIAELKLERAGLTARAGLPQQDVDTAYEEAVEALLATRGESLKFRTTVLRPYLDRLVDKIRQGDKASEERFFSAMQVSGETGAARQMSQLQAIVSTDSASGGLLRDVEELQRQLTAFDLQISEALIEGSKTSDLAAERSQVQQEYFELDSQIQADSRLSSVSNNPATISELQTAMADGESYVKFNLIGDQIFGILVQKNNVYPIRPTQSAGDVLIFKNKLRNSIDGQIEDGKLPEFSVSSAVILYQILFGDVDDILKQESVTELVVDGGKILNGISPAVLITDLNAAVRFTRQSDKFDYTDLDFLAKTVPTTVAISPRSFIASRNTAPSDAPRPLFGFASPAPMTNFSAVPATVKVGSCTLTSTQLRGLGSRFAPIPVDEINIAAKALGVSSEVNTLSGRSFTDSEVLSRGAPSGDLSDYKILHFATHGLTEGQFGCADAPAALLTSFGGAGSDLLLSFDEIARLRLNANLVVLSACETASAVGERALRLSGEVLPGETLEGLVRSFFSANARSVIATYWESSNSGESEQFMESFYSNGRTLSISGALNAAQNDLIASTSTSHPFYWGGFFAVGNTRNSMLSSEPMTLASASDGKDKL